MPFQNSKIVKEVTSSVLKTLTTRTETRTEFLEQFAGIYSRILQAFSDASDIGACFYKIRDDSVRPRHFFGTDNADEIEAILSDREGHSLHEYIDGDEPLRPIIDFDLPREVYDSIEPKLTGKEILDSLILAFRKTCLEIFPKWDPKTLAIASSTNAKKMSYHILTFGMRLSNIARIAVFTELVHWLPYASKKAVQPKNGSVFDFMIRPPNDESEVVDSPLLAIPETEIGRYSNINNVTTDAEFELVETLLQEASIEGY
ncbi:hypothetical protein RhiirC2_800485, partial [Rhizophagus irregularis]